MRTEMSENRLARNPYPSENTDWLMEWWWQTEAGLVAALIVQENTELTRTTMDVWRAAVQSAHESLRDRGMSPTAKDVWALLCQASGAALLDRPQFFDELLEQNFYPASKFSDVRYHAGVTFVPLMQGFLNEVRRLDAPEIKSPFTAIGAVNLAVSHYNQGPWYVSTRGGAATTIPAYRHLAATIWNHGPDGAPPTVGAVDAVVEAAAHVMSQTEQDVALQRASVSSLQCKRLALNHVHMLVRPRHALFVEEHPSNHECVVNDPNESSMQVIAHELLKGCRRELDSFFDKPVYAEGGLCQTWSLFELECNVMGCAGIHQQLRRRYSSVLDQFRVPDHVATTNESARALEAAISKAYPSLHKINQVAPTLLINRACRRFAHIFSYTAYPTRASDWPELATDGRRAVPIGVPTRFNVDKSNASFSQAYKAYRVDNTARRSPHNFIDTGC